MTRGMTEPTVDELLTEARDIAVTDIGRARALRSEEHTLNSSHT